RREPARLPSPLPRRRRPARPHAPRRLRPGAGGEAGPGAGRAEDGGGAVGGLVASSGVSVTGWRNQTEKGCRMAIPLQHEPEIEYPDSDGKPMAESPIHLAVMLHCIQALKDQFAQEPN